MNLKENNTVLFIWILIKVILLTLYLGTSVSPNFVYQGF